MFHRLYSKKVGVPHPMHDKEKKKPLEATENKTVTVLVWEGGFFNGIGHVGLQVVGEKPKNSASDEGVYASIWPKSTAAGGLTAIFPLAPALCTNLKHDCKQEARRVPPDFYDLMEPIDPIPIEPKVITINNLDTKKMKNELRRIETQIESGTVSYQLLPGVKTADSLNRLSNFWSGKNNQKQEVYNCVTLTQHLLKEGGLNIQESPWTTPTKLGAILTTQSESNELIKVQEKSSPTSFCKQRY